MTTSTAANTLNVDNATLTPTPPPAPTSLKAVDSGYHHPPSRQSPEMTVLERFCFRTDTAIKKNIDKLNEDASLFERYEAVRQACRWAHGQANKLEAALRADAHDYAQSQSTILSMEEVRDHLERPYADDETQRSRCEDVSDALEREADAPDHGGLTKDEYYEIRRTISRSMPTLEDRLAFIWNAEESKQDAAKAIMAIVANDGELPPERKSALLTRLEEKIVCHLMEMGKDEADAKAEAASFMDKQPVVQRQSRDRAPQAPRTNNRPPGRSNAQGLAPRNQPQYKIVKTKNYEPSETEIAAKAREIDGLMEGEEGPVTAKAQKEARGKLIKAHDKERRAAKRAAKAMREEARRPAKAKQTEAPKAKENAPKAKRSNRKAA